MDAHFADDQMPVELVATLVARLNVEAGSERMRRLLPWQQS